MRNQYLPYYVGKQGTKPYSRGAQHVFPVGDLGYKAVLTNKQLGDLVNSLKTKKPLQDKIARSPASIVKGLYSKEQILDYYEKTREPVKRTKVNSGTVSRAKKKQPTYKLK